MLAEDVQTTRLRTARSTDMAAIQRIATACAAELGAVDFAELWKALDAGYVTVAVQADQVVGFCDAWDRRDGFSWVAYLAVDPAHKGQGIGRLLLAAVRKPCRLECLDDNTAAHAFYEREGFVRTSRRRVYKRRKLTTWERMY